MCIQILHAMHDKKHTILLVAIISRSTIFAVRVVGSFLLRDVVSDIYMFSHCSDSSVIELSVSIFLALLHSTFELRRCYTL